MAHDDEYEVGVPMVNAVGDIVGWNPFHRHHGGRGGARTGRAGRGFAHLMPAQHMQQGVPQGVPLSMFAPGIAGVPTRGERQLPLALSTLNLTVGQQTGTMTGLVQRPFRGSRVNLVVTKTNAATISTFVSSIFVGADNMFANAGGAGVALPIEMFAFNSFDNYLDLNPAATGTTVSIGIQTSAALAAADVIFITGAIVGGSVG